jgi:cytochrome bd ubiquinol oxidase subunit I
MDWDVVTLSRAQFALTIMFHYLFPPLSIGLGVLMVFMEGSYLVTKNPLYERMTHFWSRIFAVNFAMGVTTGLVMEFEFGTNWAAYSRYVGDIFGSALAAEGIFAFFLESGFLAVLVFGWGRVSAKMHFFATLMVSVGSIFSSVWIIIANSWQQTPAGFHIVGEGTQARAEITDFWAMVFNPSSMPRLVHTLLGALILGAFFVMSISAYYVLKDRHLEFAKKSFRIALVAGTIGTVAIPIAGHVQADLVSTTQPAKLAAFEGHYKTSNEGAPMYLFGIPDTKEQRIKGGLAIPGGLSFLLHGNFSTPVKALDSFPEKDRPPVFVPFLTYHLMVSMGMAMLFLCALGCYHLFRTKTLFEKKWLLRLFVGAVFAPFLANQAGWVSAEVGRQPWIVYGLLRTTDAVSKVLHSEQVLGSIVMFILIYSLLFLVWVFVLNTKIQHGPADHDEPKSAGDPPGSSAGQWLDVAVGMADPASPSMTNVREKPKTSEHLASLLTDSFALQVTMDIHIFWFVVLGILLAGYAVLDGFDLGVGILHLTVRTDQERRLFLNAIGPLWDGNEVWLVTFGGALFAAFPKAYATAFSGFYVPFMGLLFALIFRGVSMEFRSKRDSVRWRKAWDVAFFVSSFSATALFGIAVGNAIQGIPIAEDQEFYATLKVLLRPYPLLVGAFSVATCAMHGAIYLVLKTEGGLQQKLIRWVWRTFGAFITLYMLTTIITLVQSPEVTRHFKEWPIAWVVVMLNVLAIANIPRALFHGKPGTAFVSSSATILALTFLFGIALFPNLLVSNIDPKFSLTIYNASSSIKTLNIMKLFAIIGFPLVATYTGIVYWVFRGKVKIGPMSY